MKKHQSGSVLAISLVLLTAITLIAIMGMQRADLQTKIVVAVQHKEAAHNTSLTSGDKIYNDLLLESSLPLSEAINNPANETITYSTPGQNPLYKVTTIIRHLEPVLLPGKVATSSLRNNNSRGKNGAGFEKFEVETTTTLPNEVRSIQSMGVTQLSPE